MEAQRFFSTRITCCLVGDMLGAQAPKNRLRFAKSNLLPMTKHAERQSDKSPYTWKNDWSFSVYLLHIDGVLVWVPRMAEDCC